MSSARKASTFLVFFSICLVGSGGVACAQAWGEQAPVHFKYANQGMAQELYRNQLGAAAAASAASSSASGGGGLGQSSNQLDNAVQLNNASTYNITISGKGDYLNISGDAVNAQQTSTGTKQTTRNSGSAPPPATKIGSSHYLNE